MQIERADLSAQSLDGQSRHSYLVAEAYHPGANLDSGRSRTNTANQFIPKIEFASTNSQTAGDKLSDRSRVDDRSIRRSGDDCGSTIRLFNLDNAAAKHTSPDAITYISKDYNPDKPANVVFYFPGMYNSAESDFNRAHMAEQMKQLGDPNTVLIAVEPRKVPGSADALAYDLGRLAEPGRFRKMAEEIFSKIGELKGRSLDDKDTHLTLMAHSAGNGLAQVALNDNGLFDKVERLISLDSVFNDGTKFGSIPRGRGTGDTGPYDNWLSANAEEFKKNDGSKQYISLYFSTAHRSEAQAKRLSQAGLGSAMYFSDDAKKRDFGQAANHSIVIMKSNQKVGKEDEHGSMPYFILETLRASNKHPKPSQSYFALWPF